MSQKIKTSVEIDGSLKASQIANATTDTDKFLVSDSGTVKYRTGAEVLSDLGITVNTASKLQHQVKAGVAINKGQAVYVTSADGTNMIVGLASNASEATSSKTMGLLDGTVAINGFANVVTEGLLSGLSITGAVSEGDPVWLGTGGNLIYGLANKPSAPNHLVFIGIVTRVNANNGEIFVKVQNGFELNEIHDVDLKTTLPSGNDILAFEGAPVNLWKNKTIASVLGYTPYNASNPAGYISSYTETDPTVPSHVKSITTTEKSNWNTAYGWGNHAGLYLGISAKAADSELLDGIDSSRVIYGDNSTGTISISDATLNGALKSGFYTVGTGGIPNATGVNFVLHTAYNGVGNAAGFDLACNDSTTSSFYLRPATGGGKGSWQTIVTSANVGSYAVPASRTITINGTSYDLSADRSWTVTASETDTLATVTSRGNTANTSIAVRNSISINKSDGSSGGQLAYDSAINQLYLWNSLSSGYFSIYTNNAERLNISSGGVVTANVDMRAPIFYDSNNTGYYVDPASTTNLNLLTTANAATIGGILSIGNSTNTKIKWGGNTTPTLGFPFTATANALWLEVNNGDTGGVVIDDDGVTVYGAGDNGYVFRVIDEDIYQGNSNVTLSTTFQVNQGSYGGGYLRGNFDVLGTVLADRYRSTNSLVLNNYTTVNPSSNVFLYSQPNDRDSWLYLDSADTGSNWGIYHRQIDSAVGGMEGNSIGFIGGGNSALKAYIGLATGNGYFANNLTVGNQLTIGALASADGMIENNTGAYFHLGGWGVGRTAATAVLVNTAYRADIADNATNAGYATSAGSASSSTRANYLDPNYIGGQQTNPQTYFNNGIGVKVAMTAAAGVWSDTLWINGYSGGDVLQMCAMHFQRNGTPRAYISVQASTATSYGSLYELWTSYNMDAPNKSGTSYYQTNTWMQFNGQYGLYWPGNYGCHFAPNDQTSYTQFKILGSKNGYGGILDSQSAVNGMMYDGSGNGGVYREANGRWYWYHHVGNNCTGISTSTTSGSYRAYIGGSLYAEGDIVAYSDRRKKENIVTVDNALNTVNKLRGVYYNRIDDDTKKRQVGVIAQEIQEVLPEVVTYAEDVDEYGVSYGNITGLLIEAIKEQQTQIEELKELVKTLINK